jgi:hypothetical protein
LLQWECSRRKLSCFLKQKPASANEAKIMQRFAFASDGPAGPGWTRPNEIARVYPHDDLPALFRRTIAWAGVQFTKLEHTSFSEENIEGNAPNEITVAPGEIVTLADFGAK